MTFIAIEGLTYIVTVVRHQTKFPVDSNFMILIIALVHRSFFI